MGLLLEKYSKKKKKFQINFQKVLTILPYCYIVDITISESANFIKIGR
jgi:hypothetical protein